MLLFDWASGKNAGLEIQLKLRDEGFVVRFYAESTANLGQPTLDFSSSATGEMSFLGSSFLSVAALVVFALKERFATPGINTIGISTA
jgi:hypothetical protein